MYILKYYLKVELWSGGIMVKTELDVFALLNETMRNKIIAVRKQHNLSLAELAKQCGYDEAELLQMEQGQKEVTPEVLAKILDVVKYFKD